MRHTIGELASESDSVARRGRMYAARNLLEHNYMRELAQSQSLLTIVTSILGPQPFCVRGILFDKLPEANWHVGWHQDQAIPVEKRIDVSGFGPWSVKAGVVHVEPPVAVLDRMLTLRVHLDDCDASNGALRLLPGSHRNGRLSVDAVRERMAVGDAVTCAMEAGDVLAMRPLLLHASSRMKTSESEAGEAGEGISATSRRRRVIHLEYAADALPGGLQWHRQSHKPANRSIEHAASWPAKDAH